MKKILIILSFLLLFVIGVELSVVYLINNGYLPLKSSSPQNTVLDPNQGKSALDSPPIETGLLSSFFYFFQIKDLPITKKSSFIGEYEGVVRNVEFTRNKAVIFYFKDFNGWFSLYKQPTLFKETQCQLFDKEKSGYVPYTFDAPPFKVSDQVDIIYEFDYQNRIVSCKIKVIN